MKTAKTALQMFVPRILLLGLITLFGGPPGNQTLVAEQAKVDFSREIRPIFESRCYECHGAQKQKSGLRLDRKSNAFRGGDSGKPAIVATKINDSPLIQKITSQDPDEMMPPKGERLSEKQVGLLQAWIEQGAAWPEEAEKKHWAYVKPTRPALPKIQNKKWPHNDIDYFVLARLEKEKLKPSPPADRATLLRRVSLDLIGLPPTLMEVNDFLADKSPEAYEKVVDRLLASPQYGERWARPWLDLARYADTQGYEKDNRRTIWPYRDWVINALNRNLPFDEFTIEQIAGDMLPDASQEQKVATGFHRNTMTNTEGGTDNEEFRHEAIVDRINTTMSVWMGTTFGCCQCHNHKYDPFTMKEYYQFYALLNNTADADNDDEKPVMKLPTSQQAEQLRKLREEIVVLDKKYNAQTPELVESQTKWEQKTVAGLANWLVLDPTEFTSAGGATFTKTEDKSLLAGGKNPSNDVYTVVVGTDLKKVTGVRLEVLPDANLPQKSLGRHPNGSFVLSRFEAELIPGDKSQPALPIVFQSASADFSQDGHSVTNLIDGKPGPGWAVSAGDEKFRVERSAYFTISNRVEFDQGTRLKITLRHESQFGEANIGRFRLSVTALDEPTPAPTVPESIRKILAVAQAERTDKQKEDLTAHYRSIAPELKPLRDELAKVRQAESDLDKTIPTTSVMEELAKGRETHMLIRGGFLSKGDKVEPGTPALFHPLKARTPDKLPDRLDLAHWLVSEDNPLTARVTMNRFWEQYFGIGIAETVQDFGTQGEPPSHPELLDWLATEFMRQKWDMKAMHKLIVMSATYCQSSRVTPELVQRDPYNRLLARGPRVRLEAEMIRDQALAISGLLSPKLGGPSVMPPQPEGLWQVVYSGDKWETSKGEDKYRRGLYTFWRRTNPHPAMTTFDAPSREFCVVKRSRSDTPLQALTLLNDPACIEAAQALARRMMTEGGTNNENRAAFALRLCLSRSPRPQELKRLVALYEQELARFRRNSEAAEKMATSELGKPPEGMSIAELAAWTVVANVLLNMDETITKG
ncbi:MAG: DUF1553 domain-containing protein [Verrucomicrobia bacterium]|nr:DUF1553 domain-containing protein [Verrucomicrobiota bacterium]